MPETQTTQARMRNFEVLASQPVGITARGGRTFSLRDDIPTGILLRSRVMPSLADRWSEAEVRLLADFEAQARAVEGDAPPTEEVSVAEQFARQRRDKEWGLRYAEAIRAEMGMVRHLYEGDVCALCGDLFRWSLPALTDIELFGEWDEATWSWQGGLFSPDEAEQIIQLFMGLRGIASLPQPSAPGGQPNATENSTPRNRAQRQAQERQKA